MSILRNRFRYRSVLGISDNNRIFIQNERILVLKQYPDRQSVGVNYLLTAEQIYNVLISPLRTSRFARSFFVFSAPKQQQKLFR